MAAHPCPDCGKLRKVDIIATPDGWAQPPCFHCGSPGYLEPYATADDSDDSDDSGPGCDCTELCSMGPTCPGGMLADLPGAGCSRTLPATTTFDAITIHMDEPPPTARPVHPCVLGNHRWAWLINGQQACGYCGTPR